VTAQIPALYNVFSSIYQLFVHIISPCLYLCVFIYNTVSTRTTAKHVVRILLNSHVCRPSKTLNHGLNHWKIHTVHQFCDFQYLLFFFGNRVRLNLYKRTPSENELLLYMKTFVRNLFNVDHFCGKILSACVRNSKNY